MLRIDDCPILNKMGVITLNQVHDEIVMEVPEENAEAAKAIVKRYMEHPFGDDVEALCIPIPVDLKIVSNWSLAK
jgi:DNA polymerase-1